MSKNIEHLQHIKSNVVIEGKPKLPTAEVLVDGELAVNYAEGYETISLRNSSSGITTFSSDDYYTKKKLGSGFTGVNSANTVTSVIEENEGIISSALNDLDERKLDASAYTPTDLSNYYTKDETSGATELEVAFSGKADSDYVEEIELVTAAALNDLEGRKLDASAYTEGMTDYYLKSETSGVTELDAAFSGKADVTWVEEKIGSAFTGANSGVTITEYIEENEETTAAALNDLNERKMDASAYTPTDLTNYYTKSETSGATEISNALGGKVNSQTFIAHTADTNAHVTSEEKTLWNAKADKSWVEEKLGSGFTGDNSANTVTSVIEENEEIVSAALNDLESRKLDASAYTPTDLTNYYTKSQTSGATEISTALGTKEDTVEIDSTAKTSSFNASVGKYYVVNVPKDGSVTVTLPTSNMSSTNVQNIIFLVTLGSGNVSITFTPIAFKSEGFNNMTAGSTYEVNALWNGNGWIMAMTKLEAV